jgi:hypothetical protein
VPERVFQPAGPLAVELILDWLRQPGAGGHRPLDHGVDVRDGEMEPHRAAAERPRAADPMLRVLVGEHDPRAVDLDLGVPDPAVRLAQAQHLGRAERLPVELDGAGRALDVQIWNQLGHRDISFLGATLLWLPGS